MPVAGVAVDGASCGSIGRFQPGSGTGAQEGAGHGSGDATRKLDAAHGFASSKSRTSPSASASMAALVDTPGSLTGSIAAVTGSFAIATGSVCFEVVVVFATVVSGVNEFTLVVVVFVFGVDVATEKLQARAGAAPVTMSAPAARPARTF